MNAKQKAAMSTHLVHSKATKGIKNRNNFKKRGFLAISATNISNRAVNLMRNCVTGAK